MLTDDFEADVTTVHSSIMELCKYNIINLIYIYNFFIVVYSSLICLHFYLNSFTLLFFYCPYTASREGIHTTNDPGSRGRTRNLTYYEIKTQV